MKESVYKSYDELPLFLNAKTVANACGGAPPPGGGLGALPRRPDPPDSPAIHPFAVKRGKYKI